LQKRLITLLDSDKAIHDPARIMRLPGFINHKEPVAVCRIVNVDPENIHDLNTLKPLLGNAPGQSEEGNQTRQVANFTARPGILVGRKANAIDRAALTASKWPGAGEGQRNCRAFQNAAYLIRNLALAENEAWPILWAWNRKNRPPLPEWELRQALQNAAIYGRHPVEGNPAG
jgi:hypothetical protein